jgi:hypothetical protein
MNDTSTTTTTTDTYVRLGSCVQYESSFYFILFFLISALSSLFVFVVCVGKYIATGRCKCIIHSQFQHWLWIAMDRKGLFINSRRKHSNLNCNGICIVLLNLPSLCRPYFELRFSKGSVSFDFLLWMQHGCAQDLSGGSQKYGPRTFARLLLSSYCNLDGGDIALNILNIFQNLFVWNNGINIVASTQSYPSCFSCSYICHGC